MIGITTDIIGGGIGPRPKNLPASAKLEEDSDDSDASIGPMNQYGLPTLLKDYDLYIKDNTEDMGFEPNTTIKEKIFGAHLRFGSDIKKMAYKSIKTHWEERQITFM